MEDNSDFLNIFNGLASKKVIKKSKASLLHCHNLQPVNEDYKLHDLVTDMNSYGYGDSFNLSSRPYPINVNENLSSEGAIISAGRLYVAAYTNWPPEGIESAGGVLTAGTLRSILIPYDDWPVESLESDGSLLASGTLRTVLLRYEDGEAESLESDGCTLTAGTLDKIVIRYTDWPEESLESAGALLTAGTLT